MKITNCAVVQDVHVHLQSSVDSATLRSIQRSAVDNFFSAPLATATNNNNSNSATSSMFSSSSTSLLTPSSLFTPGSRDPKDLVSMFLE
jgi:hypothetical protein